MPHAGLMDESALGPEEGPLMRARLHIRGGKRRLRQGKISAGLLTLYDALSVAMEWYIASPDRKDLLSITEKDNLNDERNLFAVLIRSGVVNSRFDYDAFDKLIEKAANEEMSGYDYSEILLGVESVMIQLGVMPFDENELPAEDPTTF